MRLRLNFQQRGIVHNTQVTKAVNPGAGAVLHRGLPHKRTPAKECGLCPANMRGVQVRTEMLHTALLHRKP